LIAASLGDLPDAASERARYETHENDPEDPRYRTFLNRLAAPLIERLPTGAEGIDIGSGPGPTLSVMLTERGYPTEVWDPFFAPDPTPLERRWDFVTCSETVEHFHDPEAGWGRLFGLLRPGGWLGVMTEPLPEPAEVAGQEGSISEVLAAWWYARDPTHVALHRSRTFEWLAARYRAELARPSRTVALFRTRR